MKAATSEKLLAEMFAEPWKFDFFQAVRLLERARVGEITARDGSAGGEGELDSRQFSPVGGDGDPTTEAVRFKVPASLTFPTSEVTELSRPKTPDAAENEDSQLRQQFEMNVAFLGLTGPSGVLPYHYTTSLIRLGRERDKASAEFFDLFNHRLISLFYSAWEKYRFPMMFERGRLVDSPRQDDFTTAIYSLSGFGTEGLRGRLAFEDQSAVYFSGHLARHPRSAVSLELMISEYFGYPASLIQFIGQWLVISSADHSCLGGFKFAGRNLTLGGDAVLGERVWDVSAKFRIEVGPLTYQQYKGLLPGGSDHLPIIHMIRSFAGPEMDFDIRPTLMAMEVPPLHLQSESEPLPRLGWNTWLLTGSHVGDFQAVIFESGPNVEPEKLLETKEWAA